MISESYDAIKYLNTYTPDLVDNICKVFINEFFHRSEKEIQELFMEEFKKDQIFKNKNENYLKVEAKKLLNSLLLTYEFLDRGMKGFLTGDLSYHLISKCPEIFEKYTLELNNIEEEIKEIGLNPKDFYESFFKINKKFYENNTADKLSISLMKQKEKEKIFTQKFLYYVNLKNTYFMDSLAKLDIKHNGQISDKIDDIKLRVQFNFNELYNEIYDNGITNVLKTPFHGIPHPTKENKNNLFRRQLIIEEGSFENSKEDYYKVYKSLET